MVRKGGPGSDLNARCCIRYNIGSFLAVLVLGYWHLLRAPALADPCGHGEVLHFEVGQDVKQLRKPLKSKHSTPGSVPKVKGKSEPTGYSRKGPSKEPVAGAEPSGADELEQLPEEEVTNPDDEQNGNNEGDKTSEETDSMVSPGVEAPGAPRWVFCAAQWQECSCGGKVRWGNKDKWIVMEPKKEGQILDVKCNVQVLKDIIPGDDGKHCQCQVTPGSKFYAGLNPLKQTDEEAEERGAKLVASCDIFSEGKKDGPWGASQWTAVEPFCSESWERAAQEDPLLNTGDRKIDLHTMHKLMRARVDPRFLQTYQKLFGSSGEKMGWTQRAFVNYYAGSPTGKHAKMTEELVRSIHIFSSEPVIVVHFGMSASPALTPENFPRLVLLHAEPFGHTLRRSFNFNKMRAFLFARVLAGVGLDSDQFVAPGVDRLFEMTEREITKDYPLPIMPVHFLDRGPADTGVWWARYCPDKLCSLQTLRWGHAHPSWTFWALPFIGRWLRKNFRDETLPEITGDTSAPALRIVEIPEDEDLLNVGLWEEKATKQWCKFDIVDPSEFEALRSWSPRNGNKCSNGVGCANIYGDKRFYKHGGAAKLFYTAHHAVEPSKTHSSVRDIQKRWKEGSWPKSGIVFNGKFWDSGKQLREAHPDMECIP